MSTVGAAQLLIQVAPPAAARRPTAVENVFLLCLPSTYPSARERASGTYWATVMSRLAALPCHDRCSIVVAFRATQKSYFDSCLVNCKDSKPNPTVSQEARTGVRFLLSTRFVVKSIM